MKDALTREKLGKAAWKLLLVLAGNTLYALAVALFVLPNGLITGGTTGLGLAAQYFFGLPLSAFVGCSTRPCFWRGCWCWARSLP